MKAKNFVLVSGHNEEFPWSISLRIVENSYNFSGTFKVDTFKFRTFYLTGGAEDKLRWNSQIRIRSDGKVEEVMFVLGNEVRQKKDHIRHLDRGFFRQRLSKEYMADKVLHHDWENKDNIFWVRLLDKNTHPKGGVGKKYGKRMKWIEKEEWLCDTHWEAKI